MNIMLEIKAFFGDWKEATREQAEKFYKTWYEGSQNIAESSKHKYFNEHHIRGGHVLLNGTVETTEEQKERVFNHYKNDLQSIANRTRQAEILRFNVIEYVCNFPKINPFVMAASLAEDGFTILYDDSSISTTENRRKEKQVKRLLA